MAAVIVTGSVSSTGVVTPGNGVTAVVGMTPGEIVVQFTANQFSATNRTPQVVVTPNVARLNYAASVHHVTPTGFSVWSVDLGNTPVTISFDFIAIAP